jgi:hypothetical protein
MKIYLRLKRWRGARNLPYIDVFLLFAATEEKALTFRQCLANLMDRLGLLRHPTKCFWALAQLGHHMSYFYAFESKLTKIAQQARHHIRRATHNALWLRVKDLQFFLAHTLGWLAYD